MRGLFITLTAIGLTMGLAHAGPAGNLTLGAPVSKDDPPVGKRVEIPATFTNTSNKPVWTYGMFSSPFYRTSLRTRKGMEVFDLTKPMSGLCAFTVQTFGFTEIAPGASVDFTVLALSGKSGRMRVSVNLYRSDDKRLPPMAVCQASTTIR